MSVTIPHSEPQEYTVHHNLPRSFLGSSWSENLSELNQHEHARFHEMFGHPTPDGFLRSLALLAVKYNGTSASPHDLTQVLSVLTPKDWKTLYMPEAVLQQEHTSNRKLAKVSRHIHAYLTLERCFISDAIGRLSFHNAAMMVAPYGHTEVKEFFAVQNPMEAMYKFLVDTNRKGELKYAKALHPSVRSRLLDVVKKPSIALMESGTRCKLFDVLNHHERAVSNCGSQWHPRIMDHFATLVAIGEEHDERRDRERIEGEETISG